MSVELANFSYFWQMEVKSNPNPNPNKIRANEENIFTNLTKCEAFRTKNTWNAENVCDGSFKQGCISFATLQTVKKLHWDVSSIRNLHYSPSMTIAVYFGTISINQSCHCCQTSHLCSSHYTLQQWTARIGRLPFFFPVCGAGVSCRSHRQVGSLVHTSSSSHTWDSSTN